VPAKIVRSISLTPELTALIDAKLATGHHRSASEVVRAALRLMAKQDHCAPSNTRVEVEDRRGER
jgi:putative addiction module CopG family antidote